MNKRQIHKEIYLTSPLIGVYQVIHNIPGMESPLEVPTVKVGNAIVRALRELAYEPVKPSVKREHFTY